jgi:UPF0176 protein
LGRIYVAHEGINAQLSVPKENIDKFKKSISEITPLNEIRLNIALEHYSKSFLKLTIKIREKIVADGLNENTFDVTKIGNHYESEIGFFKGAIKPDVDTFRESLEVIDRELEKNGKEKNYLMYCTGGIRCEKASAYLKHKGIKNVFQLEGGIIEYTRQVNAEGIENKFLGKNFVFDDRRAEKISDDVIAKCHQCGAPFDVHTNCANDACHLLFIQCDSCKAEMDNCCSTNCKEIHALPFEEQKELRKGQANSNDIFKKGRADHLPYKKDLRNIFEVLKKEEL